MSAYHIIRSEDYDWIALYKNGRLLHQGHSIQEEALLALVGIQATVQVGHPDLDAHGQCPDRIEQPGREDLGWNPGPIR